MVGFLTAAVGKERPSASGASCLPGSGSLACLRRRGWNKRAWTFPKSSRRCSGPGSGAVAPECRL